MNKDLRDPLASFRMRVSDPLTAKNRMKFLDPSPSNLLRVTPAKRLKLSKSTCQIGLGSFGAALVDGHTSALTYRSIPLSPRSGYVSVTGITDVCDERGSKQITGGGAAVVPTSMIPAGTSEVILRISDD
jgi:hypothetical protein